MAIANANNAAKLPLTAQQATPANAATDGIEPKGAPGNIVHSNHITPEVVAARIANNLAPQGLTTEATQVITQTFLMLLQELSLHIPQQQQQTQHNQQPPQLSLAMDQLQKLH